MAPSFSLLSLEYIPKRSPAAALPHKHEPPSTMTRVGDHGYFFFAYLFLCINDLEVRQDLRSQKACQTHGQTGALPLGEISFLRSLKNPEPR